MQLTCDWLYLQQSGSLVLPHLWHAPWRRHSICAGTSICIKNLFCCCYVNDIVVFYQRLQLTTISDAEWHVELLAWKTTTMFKYTLKEGLLFNIHIRFPRNLLVVITTCVSFYEIYFLVELPLLYMQTSNSYNENSWSFVIGITTAFTDG